MLTRLAACGAIGAARLVELRLSTRNLAESGESVEGVWTRRTYPLIVALHAAVIGGTLLAGGRARRHWLLVLLAVQPVRAWSLATLGRRWNARGAVPTGMAVETGGPYAFVRHPNYSVVAVELAALPLAFGLARLAAVATAINAALLALRIRDEEAALFRLPGYREHFERKKRFLPGLF